MVRYCRDVERLSDVHQNNAMRQRSRPIYQLNRNIIVYRSGVRMDQRESELTSKGSRRRS